LDTAELSAAFGIAYDWLYDLWTPDQKSQIISTLLKYGLQPGVTQVTTGAGWWRNNITGNWNCVCNSGLTMASLAILNDDTSGVAKQLLQTTVDNAKDNCAQAVSTDGSWAEVSGLASSLAFFCSLSFNRRPTTGTLEQQVSDERWACFFSNTVS
jgi:hypothetical protein